MKGEEGLYNRLCVCLFKIAASLIDHLLLVRSWTKTHSPLHLSHRPEEQIYSTFLFKHCVINVGYYYYGAMLQSLTLWIYLSIYDTLLDQQPFVGPEAVHAGVVFLQWLWKPSIKHVLYIALDVASIAAAGFYSEDQNPRKYHCCKCLWKHPKSLHIEKKLKVYFFFSVPLLVLMLSNTICVEQWEQSLQRPRPDSVFSLR